MTIEEAAQLKFGDRVEIHRDGRLKRRREFATILENPPTTNTMTKPVTAGYGFHWVRFDGSGIEEIRQNTVHAREIKRKL